jgi:hypothetical protein
VARATLAACPPPSIQVNLLTFLGNYHADGTMPLHLP